MRIVFAVLLSACLTAALIGCEMSKPYIMNTDRVDQTIEGNRGYLMGTPPPPKDRGELKRPLIAVDIEVPDVDERQTKLLTAKEETKLLTTGETRIVHKSQEAANASEVPAAPVAEKSAVKEEQIK